MITGRERGRTPALPLWRVGGREADGGEGARRSAALPHLFDNGEAVRPVAEGRLFRRSAALTARAPEYRFPPQSANLRPPPRRARWMSVCACPLAVSPCGAGRSHALSFAAKKPARQNPLRRRARLIYVITMRQPRADGARLRSETCAGAARGGPARRLAEGRRCAWSGTSSRGGYWSCARPCTG